MLPLAVHRDSERREKIPFVGFCNTETTKVEGIRNTTEVKVLANFTTFYGVPLMCSV